MENVGQYTLVHELRASTSRRRCRPLFDALHINTKHNAQLYNCCHTYWIPNKTPSPLREAGMDVSNLNKEDCVINHIKRVILV